MSPAANHGTKRGPAWAEQHGSGVISEAFQMVHDGPWFPLTMIFLGEAVKNHHYADGLTYHLYVFTDNQAPTEFKLRANLI